jgi:hypothetical protein
MGANITFSNINVDGAVYLWEERNPGGAYASGVTAVNLSGAGTWICPNLGILFFFSLTSYFIILFLFSNFAHLSLLSWL